MYRSGDKLICIKTIYSKIDGSLLLEINKEYTIKNFVNGSFYIEEISGILFTPTYFKSFEELRRDKINNIKQRIKNKCKSEIEFIM